jgi:hypothetical protein
MWVKETIIAPKQPIGRGAVRMCKRMTAMLCGLSARVPQILIFRDFRVIVAKLLLVLVEQDSDIGPHLGKVYLYAFIVQVAFKFTQFFRDLIPDFSDNFLPAKWTDVLAFVALFIEQFCHAMVLS